MGLLNIQFIVMDGKVYIIEANPRSSRTVPYISKITGIPIVPLAVGAIAGKTLPEMGYSYGLQPEKETVAVKMPVFSFEKITGADVDLGPEMKSTGEVLGISTVFEEALLKAFLGAGYHLKKSGNVILTVKDQDKPEAVSLARRFQSLGWTVYATGGTCAYLQKNGVNARRLNKIGEGCETILDKILSGTVDLVVDTPSKSVDDNTDGYHIRRTAVEARIPCLTSLDTANAYVSCVESQGKQPATIVDIAQI